VTIIWWNPEKELKDERRRHGRDRLRDLWNPEKELKGGENALGVHTIKKVESGEGIERP